MLSRGRRIPHNLGVATTPPTAPRLDRPPTAAELREAAQAVGAVAVRTPLLRCDALSRATGADVWLKPENLQRTGSYKVRGAYNKIRLLPAAARARGVITASAGNHAQGVALAARRLNVPAVVVMPASAPITKVMATRELGAEVVLHGETFEEAQTRARALEAERGLTFVHPFDDWEVIAGQASVAFEVLEDFPHAAGRSGPDVLIVPVGGGGLIAGIRLALDAAGASGTEATSSGGGPQRRPRAPGHAVRLIGVQARGADATVRSLAAGHAIAIEPARTIADGIRVGRPGERPLQALLGRPIELLTIADDDIARAMTYLLERAKLVVEPAGAVGVAALLAGTVWLAPGEAACVVLSGGNVDVNLLARIIEHGLTRAGRYLVIRTRLDDRPGQLAQLLAPLAAMRVNVIDIEHHRAGWLLPVGQSDVVLHLETRDAAHAREILATLRAAGYAVEALTPPRDE